MKLVEIIWLVVGTVVPSFLVAWLGTAGARGLAPRLGLLDQPNARKVHSKPIPLGGGVAIALGVIVPFLFGQLILSGLSTEPSAALSASSQPGEVVAERAMPGWLPEFVVPHLHGLEQRLPELWVLLFAASLLMLLGLLDDWRHLDWRPRLAAQFLIAGFCVVQQGWRLTAFIDLPQISWWVSVLLSVFWIVGLINSFNMLDNMDGLSAGVAAIASFFLAVVMLLAPDPQTHQPQLFVAGFLLVLVGSLLGFLWHNRPPARIFMGDAGSYFVGFCVGCTTLLATYTSYESQTPFALFAPLCVMAVPLYDMTTVIWIRLRLGHSPFQPDKNHFSHRLVELGFTKSQAVATIYLLTTTCGLGALLLHRVDGVGAIIVLSMIGSILILIAILETTARRKLHE